jgi:hypothetical protein
MGMHFGRTATVLQTPETFDWINCFKDSTLSMITLSASKHSIRGEVALAWLANEAYFLKLKRVSISYTEHEKLSYVGLIYYLDMSQPEPQLNCLVQ